ncbi:MAG: hypothetical protein U0R78_05280 [Nocardioidaceae bacterium]
MRACTAELVPITAELGLRRRWAATIDYTPDHLPIIGPMLRPYGSSVDGAWARSRRRPRDDVGPWVSRSVADLVVTGHTDVVDVGPLGMDRFDEHGRSNPAADPIALPFPEQA